MKDSVILKMAEETCSILDQMMFHEPCDQLGASYNALIAAAQANHPDDAFLKALKPIQEPAEGSKNQMQILFTQLRIVLDALQATDGIDDRQGNGTST